MTHTVKKLEDAEVAKKMSPSSVYMPLLLQSQQDKTLTCTTTGYPIHYKCTDSPNSHPPKSLFIEYHSPVPQYIPGKSTGHHGNSRPCYMCHHGNMITPTNGCISYAPVQVPPRYNGVCFCLLCQQRAASLSCNCQSCLSLRFEQTAASLLHPSDKEQSIKSAVCCNGVMCENMTVNRPQYPEYCHCAECVSRMSKDLRINNNLQVIIHRHDNTRPGEVPPKDKDPNNNDSSDSQNENADTKTDVTEQQQRHNGEISPKAKELTVEHQTTSCNENQNRKRKHELQNDHLLESKIIKKENIDTTFEVKSNNETASVEHMEEEDTKTNEHTPSPSPKEERAEQSSNENTEILENQDNTSNPSSLPQKYYNSRFDYKDSDSDIKDNNQDSDSESHEGGEHRHYNTRLTSTNTPSYDNQGSPKLKKDKEMYADITKSISRQRSKLNRLLANEHERRRVAQLNSAYQDLRQLIPGYQCDTKLPKIKILRYAINYIAHLDDVLEMDDSENERV